MSRPADTTVKSSNRLRDLLARIAARRPIDLGKPHAKGYRLAAGRRADGTPMRFWLGHEAMDAHQRAIAIVKVWAEMTDASVPRWTEPWVEAARSSAEHRVGLLRYFADGVRSTDHEGIARVDEHQQARDPLGGTPVAKTPASGGETLYGAIAAFLQSFRGKRRADSHKWRAEQVLDRTLKATRPDCPLAAIDYRWLDALADHFKCRPLSRRGKGRDRKPISPQTVKTTLQYLRAFFVWLDDTGYGGWAGPAKLAKPFRVSPDELRTPAERRMASEIRQFDIPTLVRLYHAADARQRALMLTALFAAATQIELSVLQKDEFDLAAGLLRHHRNKTGVEGRFWLPPELVVLLRDEFARHPDQPLAFYTKKGNPLVSYTVDGRLASDSVAQMWVDLRKRAGLPDALSFKYLRKFAADYVTRHGGEALGQAVLSHAPTTMLGRHYTRTRDWDALHAVQRRMHAEFIAAGMLVPGSPTAVKLADVNPDAVAA